MIQTTNTVRDQVATLKYIKWNEKYVNGEKPFQLYADLPVDIPDSVRGNVEFGDGEPEIIRDIRGLQHEFDLDTHGFAFREFLPDDFVDWENADAVSARYYPQMERLMKKHVPGADKVHMFQHRLRRSDPPPPAGSVINATDPTLFMRPAGTVHIDLSCVEVLDMVNNLIEDEEDKDKSLLSCRVRVINLWRPLFDPAEDWPLAVCDGSTVKDADLLAIDQVRRHWRGEGLCPLYRPHYRWHYLSDQTPNEVLFLKNFDSEKKVEAKYSPHAAFHPKDLRRGAPKRSSIEVRALVFTRPSRVYRTLAKQVNTILLEDERVKMKILI